MAQAVQDKNVQTTEFANGALGGRWRVRGRIGSHPYGSIYEAFDVSDQHRVEIEVLRGELFESLDFWGMSEFLETHLAPVSELQHRTIDSCVSYGVHEGLPYLVYERNSQFSLRSLLNEQSRLPLATVREIAEHLLLALTTAHRCGIRHLGVCPERVLLTLDAHNARVAMLRGFGVASGLSRRYSNMSLMTKTGLTIAPPAYMSPELFSGPIADERADLYSLGVVLYEMLCGQPPYLAESNIDLLLQLRSESHSPIAELRPEYADDEFIVFVERLLSKSVHARPSSASVCLSALRSLPKVQRPLEQNLQKLPVETELSQPASIHSQRKRREPDHPTSSWYQGWLGPLLIAAVLLNTVLFMLLFRATQRDARVTQLARIEQNRAANNTIARARLADESNTGDLQASKAERVPAETNLEDTSRAEADATTAREKIRAERIRKELRAEQTRRRTAETSSVDSSKRPPTESTIDSKAVGRKTSSESLEDPTESEQTPADPKEKSAEIESREVAGLGISVRPVDEAFIEQNGLLNAQGLLVESATPDGPAYKAGLRKHDILQFSETAGESILSWQPRPLKAYEELVDAVQHSQASDTRLALIIKRGSYDGLVVFVRDVGE